MNKKRLKRVYVEITNVCNLDCIFCPGTNRKKRFLAPEKFRIIARKIQPCANYLYLHVMGEPLLHPRLGEILKIAGELGFRVCLTTNGILLDERLDVLANANCLHKISVSLHSMEGNNIKEINSYLCSVWKTAGILSGNGVICALRLWNIHGADSRNVEILSYLAGCLGVHPLKMPQPRDGSWKLGERLYLEQAEVFEWPDLTRPEGNVKFCPGLRDQAAVLCDGTVVPCCLDHEGDIALGNLLQQELPDILDGPRAQAVYNGFSNGKPSEELCRKCGFAERFHS